MNKIYRHMALNDRKKALFGAIVKEYIKTARAVGSEFLASKYHLDRSSATIRNEMMELEKQGFLTHPFTSAGRIPTEKGYRFYIENFLEDKDLSSQDKVELSKAIKQVKDLDTIILKNLAKAIAELSREAVFVGFGPQDVYYTGLTNVFRQPEFSEREVIYDLSEVVDHLDEAVNDIFDEINYQIRFLIGKKNPFGKECSAILTKYHLASKDGLLGILGPMRMDYQNNQTLLKYTQELISNI